ncbi:hypothetical protein F5Y15DRAFT_294881 [Xylariaceae sp. FL0016]|nr:hypothetical protein F5Y15DRAFT_294881 [Xylariaceae sp. FL0016]
MRRIRARIFSKNPRASHCTKNDKEFPKEILTKQCVICKFLNTLPRFRFRFEKPRSPVLWIAGAMGCPVVSACLSRMRLVLCQKAGERDRESPQADVWTVYPSSHSDDTARTFDRQELNLFFLVISPPLSGYQVAAKQRSNSFTFFCFCRFSHLEGSAGLLSAPWTPQPLTQAALLTPPRERCPAGSQDTGVCSV